MRWREVIGFWEARGKVSGLAGAAFPGKNDGIMCHLQAENRNEQDTFVQFQPSLFRWTHALIRADVRSAFTTEPVFLL